MQARSFRDGKSRTSRHFDRCLIALTFLPLQTSSVAPLVVYEQPLPLRALADGRCSLVDRSGDILYREAEDMNEA